jgi:hypothetical protein
MKIKLKDLRALLADAHDRGYLLGKSETETAQHVANLGTLTGERVDLLQKIAMLEQRVQR